MLVLSTDIEDRESPECAELEDPDSGRRDCKKVGSYDSGPIPAFPEIERSTPPGQTSDGIRSVRKRSDPSPLSGQMSDGRLDRFVSNRPPEAEDRFVNTWPPEAEGRPVNNWPPEAEDRFINNWPPEAEDKFVNS